MLEETLLPLAVEYRKKTMAAKPAGAGAQVRRALEELAPRLDSVLETVACARLAAIGAAHGPNVAAREAVAGRCPDRCSQRPERWFSRGCSGVRGLRVERAAASGWLDEASIEDGAERRIVWQARVVAV